MMEFMDSFDHYNTSDELVTKWTSANGAVLGQGRNGQGLVLGNGFTFKSVSLQNTWFVGFAMNMNIATGFGPMSVIYQISNVGTVIASLAIDPDGSLSLWSGNGFNNLIATTLESPQGMPFYIQPRVWYYIEIGWTIGSGTNLPVAAELKINNVIQASGTAGSGIDGATLLVPNSGANVHAWATPDVFGNLIIDDLNIKNGNGAYNNTFIGDIKIGVLFPRADVTSGWTGLVPGNQYSQINSQFPLGDVSYVYATSNPMTPSTPSDNFQWQPVSPFLGTIMAVQYLVWARKDDEGTREIQQFCGSPGNSQPGSLSPVWSLGDSYLYYYYDMDVDPATTLPWTQDGFNGTQFGFQLVG
jgi:hypothetical protein